MAIELEKSYNPKNFEDKWRKFWDDNKFWHPEIDKSQDPYVIMIPPPNVTGILHMGHALNNTIIDTLTRWKRMQGFNTLYLPGTDHAGIATQKKVEERLAKNGLKRTEMSRKDFITKVWEWKEEHGSIILNQLAKLGCATDKDRERFTLDEGLSKAVREIFVKLYEDGLVYKDNYIVNYDPGLQTVISNEEVIYEERKDKLYYIKYPIKDSNDYLTIATVRPETMLGDTAVAVHPEDERYKKYIGKIAILPIMEREIPIISDKYVETEFGTGALKITPGHDPNDFEIGIRHKLDVISVIDKDMNMNNNCPDRYIGLDRFEARDEIIKELKDKDLFIREEDYLHKVSIGDRSGVMVEPLILEQWFVNMKPLAEKAIEIVENDTITLTPDKWKKVYLHWMNNIRPWPISRQLWWGHRIPVWICNDCGKYTVTREDPTECTHCNSNNIHQETDVLDTWFSSWLWPFSTLGWPDKTDDLDYFYPTDVLSTAPEILFFWVARMIMAGLYALDEIPFKRVYFHSTVLDEIGRKQSKSLNNSLDPLEVIKYFGADALRFTILSLAPIGQNIKVGLDTKTDETIKRSKFSEIGSKFCNKLWNASRFFLLNLDEKYVSSIDNVKLDEIDKWILSELNETIKTVNNSLDAFRFNDVANTLYHFVWDNYCDWYLELSKVRLYGDNEESKKTATTVLLHVLEQTLKLLHPLMPFITEEIYQKLPNHDISIMISKYPEFNSNLIDEEAEKDFALIQEMVYNIRNIRGETRIPIEKKIDVIFKIENEKSQNILNKFSNYIKPLAKVSKLTFGKDKERPEKSAYAVGSGYEIYIPLSGILDIDNEIQRIQKEINKAENELERVNNKLNNDKFINNAPEEVVEKEKGKRNEFQNSIEKLKHNLELIS